MGAFSCRILPQGGFLGAKILAVVVLSAFLYAPNGSCNRDREEQINRDARLADSNGMLCSLFNVNCATTIGGPIVLWSGATPSASEPAAAPPEQ